MMVLILMIIDFVVITTMSRLDRDSEEVHKLKHPTPDLRPLHSPQSSAYYATQTKV